MSRVRWLLRNGVVVGFSLLVPMAGHAATGDRCGTDLLGKPLACVADDDDDHDEPRYADGVFYPSPPVGDVLREWTTAHLIYPQLANALSSDKRMLTDVAVVDGPYVVLNRRTNLFGDEAGKTARTLLETVLTPMSRAAAVTAMAWDLGLTPSVPWITTRRKAVTLPANAHARASMIKAGVEPGIYEQARRLVGNGSVVVMAHVALAMQSLKERLARTRDPSAVAVSQGVFDRVAVATSAGSVSDSDLAALMRELETALAEWPGGMASVHGFRQLPGVLRLARLAAAYHEERRPAGAAALCDGHGKPTAAATTALCIDTASDRAVAAWYAGMFRSGITRWRAGPGLDVDGIRFVEAVDSVVPFWVGALSTQTRLAPVSTELVTQWVATHAREATLYPETATDAIFAAATRSLCMGSAP
jgi:hypothetical protein